MRTPYGRSGAVVQEQVGGDDVLLCGSASLCNQLIEGVLGSGIAVQRQEVYLWVVFHAVVYGAVHVDSQIWDDQQVAVDVEELRCNTGFGLDQRTTGNRQRTVKPGGINHAAVALGVQLNIFSLDHLLRVIFDLEGRGIAVAGNDVEAFEVFGWDLECDDRGKVAGHKVFSALFDLPVFVFAQLLKALLGQLFFYIFDDMKTAWGLLNKVE